MPNNAELPKAPHKPKKYPTKASVEEELKRREEQGLPNNLGALTMGNHRDVTLLNSAREFGIELPKKRKPPEYPTKASVEKELKRREEQGLPNNPGALQTGKHKNRALYNSAREFNVELPSLSPSRKLPFSDVASVLRALEERARKGWPNNPEALMAGKYQDMRLDRAVVRFSGKIRFPTIIEEQRYLTRESVIEALGERKKGNLPVDPEHLLKIDPALYYAMIRYGIELIEYSTRESVLEALKKREDKGLPNDIMSLTIGEYKDRNLARASVDFGVKFPKSPSRDISSGI